ncbi:DUF1846 domain-containing protein [Lachnospiraceae bacterium OttesenSCG-928-D06]|nr:DUF1846 domain-containing protein [Lachnospiraceae bacterium OttesenSCG-928-D06]
MFKIGFDSQNYLKMQSEFINDRIKLFGNKLYLEFGGKLFDDYHAARVLPGFEADSKIRMLSTLSDKTEIILVINCMDIEKNRIRGDIGITYDADVLRLIDAFQSRDLYVSGVVITHYSEHPATAQFKEYLEQRGIRVYKHYYIEDYPTNMDKVLCEDGFGKNDFIETTRPLVVITAPGPGSGKMATCLSQLYHENLRGNRAGYAKYETFPVWNLPLNHPVNLAYEAATVDLNDVNMIDPFHLDAYNVTAINYNRDIEVFPILNEVITRIIGENPYKSPTDMGVNMAGNCIIDDEVCRFSSNQEIIRRYYTTQVDLKSGKGNSTQGKKMELLMNKAGLSPLDRPTVSYALDKSKSENTPSVAIELPDGRFVTGKTSSLLGASSAALLNALKVLANIHDDIRLISPVIIEPIQQLKTSFLGNKNPRLHTDEVLIALSICAATNPMAELVMEQLQNLKNSEVHSSVILSEVDLDVFKSLGMNVTTEPVFESNKLYHKNRR